jgi:peptidoglycan/LPS O-acetylase OafA/YrhL
MARGAGIAEAAPNLTPPPGNPRFPLFDSLRAIAALSVFLGHTVTGTLLFAQHQHQHLFIVGAQAADQGVAIFFLISGFLLYRPFLVARRGGRKVRLADFAWRRTLRIVPAYWVALTLFIVAGVVSGVTAHNWWIFYGFGQTYSSRTISSGIGAGWTLCVEVTFYVFLPFFATAAARLSHERMSVRGDVVLLIVLSIASLAFRGEFNSASDFATVASLPGTFVWFALGMGLAIASISAQGRADRSWFTRVVAERPAAFWLAAALGSVLLYQLIHNRPSDAEKLIGHGLYGLIALCILLPGVFGDTDGGVPRRVLRLRALAWIGLISYSFYLYHTIVIDELVKHVSHQYAVVFVISGLLTCVIAAASYYVVERPMMRLRRNDLRSRAGAFVGQRR